MALVSGRRSTLNPNAQPFIPASVRQVEDFSPEWWNLVTTSTWFHDYWTSQQRGEDDFVENDGFVGGDVVLPDNIDLGVDEDILNMEAQFEEFLQLAETGHGDKAKGMSENGLISNSEALIKSISVPKERDLRSPKEAMRYWEKPAKHVGPKHSPRFIQQPR
ncbi:protein EARLY RESPONSIVE TO DEHYDRATION 15-like [Dorcoceras hygrometricum]|uniref:Protein EARLY RESPONSIVE TO DEHYDRATION 15-like n=1 Tax=Dorcoceras hygrometricum TaxID=472368 RepID=A0A2Z7AA96_9LAMI|nr:protein EARLY RESPONSIVE TO DEHYDRATION 15-like [Dorcoceras hygrometricum]